MPLNGHVGSRSYRRDRSSVNWHQPVFVWSIRISGPSSRYGHKLTGAFQDIHVATRKVAPEAESESLTLSTMPSFAARWLIPRLTSFNAAYPDTTVRVQAETNVEALEHSSADLKIRDADAGIPGAI